MNSRLTNMAITTGNFLSREEIFSRGIINKIDSLTTITITRKTVQAYDYLHKKIYSFNDDDEDTLSFDPYKINEARALKKIYTRIDSRDVVFYHYKSGAKDLVIVAAGYDLFGHQNLKRLGLILLLSFFIGILVAFAGGYAFSRWLLIPLTKIADEVNEISAYNLVKRMDSGSTPDEWHYLSETLNRLLNRLQESFELQSRFISNASHELSTPLTNISSQLEISLQKERTPEQYREVIESVYQDIQNMGKLTHTLLEFAKGSGSKGGIEIKPVRIDEIILRLSSEVRKANNSFSVVLNFNKLPENEENLVVLGNEELLFTAINNIVLNGCKYSKNHQADISLFADDKNIRIAIQNSGSVIPQSEYENIFQPFYRVDGHQTGDGFGLGLSLAKRIINLHNGEITVNSLPGEITIFTISLKPAKIS